MKARVFLFLSLVFALIACTKPEDSTPVSNTPATISTEAQPAPPASEPSPETQQPVADAPHEDPKKPEEPETIDPLLGADLLAVHQTEARQFNSETLRKINEQTIDRLYESHQGKAIGVRIGKNRLTSLDPIDAQKLIDSMNFHPVVSLAAYSKYNRPGVEIGFCFGRATYAHLALLKMGIDKKSIRKAWLVGPMNSGNTNWQFHVATLAYGNNGQWLVIDNYTGLLTELRQWLHQFYPQNEAYGNLRLYITSPAKFSVSLPKYDRVQMGLDLSAVDDWYQNYFVDLMKWFQHHSLSEVGLRDLRQEPPLR